MKKYFIFMFIILTLLTSGVAYSHELDSRLVGKVMVLDAGHGGKDRGTNVGDVYESDINLSLVLKLKNALNKHGVDVILTRDGDFDLSSPHVSRRKKSDFDNRIRLINNSGADLYLSIHINYLVDSRYYGAQVFFTKSNEEKDKKSFKSSDSHGADSRPRRGICLQRRFVPLHTRESQKNIAQHIQSYRYILCGIWCSSSVQSFVRRRCWRSVTSSWIFIPNWRYVCNRFTLYQMHLDMCRSPRDLRFLRIYDTDIGHGNNLGSDNCYHHGNTRGICFSVYGIMVKEDNSRTGRRNLCKK